MCSRLLGIVKVCAGNCRSETNYITGENGWNDVMTMLLWSSYVIYSIACHQVAFIHRYRLCAGCCKCFRFVRSENLTFCLDPFFIFMIMANDSVWHFNALIASGQWIISVIFMVNCLFFRARLRAINDFWTENDRTANLRCMNKLYGKPCPRHQQIQWSKSYFWSIFIRK